MLPPCRRPRRPGARRRSRPRRARPASRMSTQRGPRRRRAPASAPYASRPRASGRALRAGPRAVAVRTLPLVDVPYPTKYAFFHAALSLAPYVVLSHRCLLVQFLQGGALKTLLFNPTDIEGARSTPYFAQLARGIPERLEALRLLAGRAAPRPARAARASMPPDVDYVAFDHMHVQDLRPILGTEDGRVPARFPNATLLVPRVEWDHWDDLHPLQRAWFVRDGRLGVRTDRIAFTSSRPHARRRRDAPANPGPHDRQPDALRQHELGCLGRQRERHRGRQLVARSTARFRGSAASAGSRTSTSCSTRTRPRAAPTSTPRWSSRRPSRDA